MSYNMVFGHLRPEQVAALKEQGFDVGKRSYLPPSTPGRPARTGMADGTERRKIGRDKAANPSGRRKPSAAKGRPATPAEVAYAEAAKVAAREALREQVGIRSLDRRPDRYGTQSGNAYWTCDSCGLDNVDRDDCYRITNKYGEEVYPFMPSGPGDRTEAGYGRYWCDAERRKTSWTLWRNRGR